jgi:hypothetical protein
VVLVLRTRVSLVVRDSRLLLSVVVVVVVLMLWGHLVR